MCSDQKESSLMMANFKVMNVLLPLEWEKETVWGKVLAQVELLLFLTVFIQNLEFSFPKNYGPSTFQHDAM